MDRGYRDPGDYYFVIKIHIEEDYDYIDSSGQIPGLATHLMMYGTDIETFEVERIDDVDER